MTLKTCGKERDKLKEKRGSPGKKKKGTSCHGERGGGNGRKGGEACGPSTTEGRGGIRNLAKGKWNTRSQDDQYVATGGRGRIQTKRRGEGRLPRDKGETSGRRRGDSEWTKNRIVILLSKKGCILKEERRRFEEMDSEKGKSPAVKSPSSSAKKKESQCPRNKKEEGNNPQGKLKEKRARV